MNTCILCQRQYIYQRNKGHTQVHCNSCMANKHRQKRKIQMVEYKGGKCQKCGYNKCLAALCFHHLDPSIKDFNISGFHCRNWEIVKKELDKCILLCHNCHCEVHYLTPNLAQDCHISNSTLNNST